MSVEKDIEAVAPLHMEEDENGDDKMAVEEDKASAESKGTRAVSDVEMKEANEPARSNDTAEPIRKMKSSPAEQTPNQEKELGESEGSNLQLDKESDAEISKWEEKVCLNTFGVCLYSYILLDDNICLIIFSFYCMLSD